MKRIAASEAKTVIAAEHYLRIFPTGWTRCYEHDGVYVVYSIPANKNLANFLFGPGIEIRELARLWAPDGHVRNALTRAVAESIKLLRKELPEVQGLVSFADPNVNHHGGIYQALSWIYTGQSEESRGYLAPDGRIVSRRAFHSNTESRLPDLPCVKREGKHRYAKPLTRYAARRLRPAVKPYPKPGNPEPS